MIKLTEDSGPLHGWLGVAIILWLLSAVVACVVAPRKRAAEFFFLTLLVLGPLGVGFASVAQPRDAVARGRIPLTCPRCAARHHVPKDDGQFYCWRCDEHCLVHKGRFGSRRVDTVESTYPHDEYAAQSPHAAHPLASAGPAPARSPRPVPVSGHAAQPMAPVPYPPPGTEPAQGGYAPALPAVPALPAEDKRYPTQGKKFWQQVGIDPVQITWGQETLYTLRCYLNRHPVFLGRAGMVYVFPTPEALNGYLASGSAHDLASLDTFDSIRLASARGTVRYSIEPENDYFLTGLAGDIKSGQAGVNTRQLNLAIELMADVAAYGNDLTVTAALAPNKALGRFVTQMVSSGQSVPTPGLPQLESSESPAEMCAEAAQEWEALERFLNARLSRK